jgi:site-specific DNA recombinase
MRRTHSSTNGRIPAAAYYRMSSDKQDRSIDEQREEVRRYAQENGYEIVREYSDAAISGWKAEQRAGFQRLIADAQKGSFQAVLCWDQDRFSRFPVLEANHYWYLLDKAGVHIATVAQGRLDLDDLGGWLKASVTQHGKAEYCRDLSRNTVRGMRERRLKGIWSGRPPYGYRRGEDGKLDLGDPAEIAIVRDIFQMRQDGMGFKRIAQVLNERKVPTPQKSLWGSQTIKYILRRETYRGAMWISKHGTAKYHRISDKPLLLENTHPAIIDEKTWAAAQAMNGKRRKHHTRNGSEGAHLAGLLRCNRCGAQMYAVPRSSNRGLYVCGTNHNKGGCGYCWVHQDSMLSVVADKLRQHLLLGSVERLTEAIERKLKEAPVTDSTAERKRTEKQLAAVEQKIQNGVDRILEVDQRLVPKIEAQLVKLEEDAAALRKSLATRPKKAPALDAKAVAAQLWQLDDVLRTERPSVVRSALLKVIDRIDLNYEQIESTKSGRRRFRFSGGTMYLSTSTTGEQLPV